MDEEKKARLGNRFSCFSCGTRFYDLNKPDPICPKCSADQREMPAVEPPKRTRKKATKKKAKINRSLLKEEEVASTDAELSPEDLEVGSEIQLDVDD